MVLSSNVKPYLLGAGCPQQGAEMTKNSFRFFALSFMIFGRVFHMRLLESSLLQKLVKFNEIRPVNEGEPGG